MPNEQSTRAHMTLPGCLAACLAACLPGCLPACLAVSERRGAGRRLRIGLSSSDVVQNHQRCLRGIQW
eukprot:1565615-Heterocapsa_arctica.AAC.1